VPAGKNKVTVGLVPRSVVQGLPTGRSKNGVHIPCRHGRAFMQPTKNTRNVPFSSPRPAGTTVDDRKKPASAKLLGIWRLGQPIHIGQHSQLFTAQPADADGNPRFDYVVRTISEERQYREESVAQIHRFATAAGVAKHPNLIVVLDSSLESATPFIIMPRLTGCTLAQWLTSQSLQPLPVVLWAIRQAAQGLAALHASSWVHGDVKSENLFVGQLGHITLLDLGFARPIGTPSGSTFMGTPQYASPECLSENPSPAITASDIWSLGKVLLELLAWTSPSVRNQAALEPAAELVSEMLSEEAASRPTADVVASRLLRLEIETLGEHIQPSQPSRSRAA